MKRLKYSPDYTEKMRELKKYLDFQFGEEVRKKVIKKIGNRVRSLCEHEQMGIAVRDMYGVDTDCLCVFVARNYVFYRIKPDHIYIVNIYNEREDFMMDLFGIKALSRETDDYSPPTTAFGGGPPSPASGGGQGSLSSGKLKLIKLSNQYKQQLGEMLEEWMEDQRINHTNHSPWAIFMHDYHDFDDYLSRLERKEEVKGKVPNSVFFLLDEKRDRLIGAADIRHYLNEGLMITGGHIGDGIRPSERGKGYGTELVRLALMECKKMGITRVLMTCDKENPASARTIIKNGGVLENEVLNEKGIVEQRYWIDLSASS